MHILTGAIVSFLGLDEMSYLLIFQSALSVPQPSQHVPVVLVRVSIPAQKHADQEAS